MDTATTHARVDFSDEDLAHRANIDKIKRGREGYLIDYLSDGTLIVSFECEELFRLSMEGRKLYFSCHGRFLHSAKHIIKHLTMGGRTGRKIDIGQDPDTLQCWMDLKSSDKERLLFLLGEEIGAPLAWDGSSTDTPNVHEYCQTNNITTEHLKRLFTMPSTIEVGWKPNLDEPLWTTR